jgi:hypothetical protein
LVVLPSVNSLPTEKVAELSVLVIVQECTLSSIPLRVHGR